MAAEQALVRDKKYFDVINEHRKRNGSPPLTPEQEAVMQTPAPRCRNAEPSEPARKHVSPDPSPEAPLERTAPATSVERRAPVELADGEMFHYPPASADPSPAKVLRFDQQSVRPAPSPQESCEPPFLSSGLLPAGLLTPASQPPAADNRWEGIVEKSDAINDVLEVLRAYPLDVARAAIDWIAARIDEMEGE
jgi:hypothetical protein